jgi:hypothetical protein
MNMSPRTFGRELFLSGLRGRQCKKSWPSIVGSLPPLKNVATPGRIPWFLVAVKSKSSSGTLDKVDYVMRVATDGGVAPTEPPRAGAPKLVRTDLSTVRQQR